LGVKGFVTNKLHKMKKLIVTSMVLLSVGTLALSTKETSVKLVTTAVAPKKVATLAKENYTGIADMADKRDVATADELN